MSSRGVARDGERVRRAVAGDAGGAPQETKSLNVELALVLVGVLLVLAFLYVLRQLLWVSGPPTFEIGLGGYAVALILLGLGAFVCFYFAFSGT
jgi:hypothetical protein